MRHNLGHGEQRLRALFWCVALLIGGIEAWAARDQMNPDGVAYLDIGDAYWRGDWARAINGYWSPLYSCLLGLALRALKPSAYWEFSVVHLVNFLIYVASAWSFSFFWSAVFEEQKIWRAQCAASGRGTWSRAAWLALGYTVFFWSSTRLVAISAVTPDLGVTALIYLASGLLMRIRHGKANGATFALFGAVLGGAYLAKTAMFFVAVVFLGVSLFSVSDLARAFPRVLLALFLFVAVVSPFIGALSRAKGRLTIGEAGTLNYAWSMDPRSKAEKGREVDPDRTNIKHGRRRIFDRPAVYEYSTETGGTLPWNSDPSHWNRGPRITFNLRRWIRVFIRNLGVYFHLFAEEQGALLAGLLILFTMSQRGWATLRDVAASWPVLLPAVAAMGMYALVWVEPRYVAAFIVLLWAGLLSRLSLAESEESRRMLAGVTLAAVILLGSTAAGSMAYKLQQWQTGSNDTYWEVANGLKRMGIRPQDKVACIGFDRQIRPYWARLSRLTVVARIPTDEVPYFWAAEPAVKSRVMEALARTGAKVAVAETIPRSQATSPLEWRRIGKTEYYASMLPTHSPTGRVRTMGTNVQAFRRSGVQGRAGPSPPERLNARTSERRERTK
jgi:hypothetical protein